MDNQVAIKERNITDMVLNKVRTMEQKQEIMFPMNYCYENALKSAWLMLQDVTDRNKQPVLQACTKESIANTLLDMIVQGLSPMKKQCYFVAYGKNLTLVPSYFGAVAQAKRINGVIDVIANCIYENDTFSYTIDPETGHKKITEHSQDFENIDLTKIKGAYAIILTEGDTPNYIEVMNMKQIEQAWAQRQGPSKSDTHNKFTDQMAMKTVINRAVKHFINTSDDSDIIAGAINNASDFERIEDVPANSIVVDFAEVADVEVEAKPIVTEEMLPENDLVGELE